ncbi:hypothetical protein BVRB_4g089780 [Beta vulgaris subsp. vulgaris]|nr:hypothetical protein BVRB_4g089780 [Beta vulgaris subsp. vulgaris]
MQGFSSQKLYERAHDQTLTVLISCTSYKLVEVRFYDNYLAA